MATVSFTKDIVIKESEAVKRFADIVCDKSPKLPINKALTSDKEMERGKELLRQSLSH